MNPNKLIAPAVAMGATWAVKRGLESGYRILAGGEPPAPEDRDEKLGAAIVWAVTTAAAVAVINVVVARLLTPAAESA